METSELLTRMSEAPHVSGHEGELVKLLTEVFDELADVYVDKFGNLIALKRGNRNGPRIMFMAHMDEIGMMVSALCDDGFVKFTKIGGIDPRNMIAQEVIIHGKKKIFGVIGIKPPHLTSVSEQKKTVELHDMVIDTGYSKETLSEIVKPGDIITFNQKVKKLKNNRLSGKSFDDVAGIAAMYCAMKNLEDFNHDADVYFVASAQEEVGIRGSKTATYTIKPDIAIAIEVTFGKTAGLAEHESYELGKGPSLAIGPFVSRKLFENLKDVASSNRIPYQVAVYTSSTGTDADAYQITEGGVHAGLLGIPLKYMHSTVETVSLDDVELTGKLMSEYVMSLNNSGKEGEECFWKN